MDDIREIKELLKSSFLKIKEDVDRNQLQINMLMEENRRIMEENGKLRSTISQLATQIESKKEDTLKKEVIRKFTRHKKEMIKHKIVENVRMRRMTLPELKELIVDQMTYCSKATFYRYYEDLKNEGTITVQNKIIVSNVLSIV